MPIYNFQCAPTPPATPQNLLGLAGALLSCEVSIPTSIAAALQKNQKPLPAPSVGPMLIDTGASATCVEDSILRNLGLSPIDQVSVMTPSGSDNQYIYLAKIMFPGTPLPALEMRIIGSNLKGQKIIGLLGRDILQHFILIMNGPAGSFSLAF